MMIGIITMRAKESSFVDGLMVSKTEDWHYMERKSLTVFDLSRYWDFHEGCIFLHAYINLVCICNVLIFLIFSCSLHNVTSQSFHMIKKFKLYE